MTYSRRHRSYAPRILRWSSLIYPLFLILLLSRALETLADDVERGNATALSTEEGVKGSFADIIDRALQKEFPESEQNGEGR